MPARPTPYPVTSYSYAPALALTPPPAPGARFRGGTSPGLPVAPPAARRAGGDSGVRARRDDLDRHSRPERPTAPPGAQRSALLAITDAGTRVWAYDDTWEAGRDPDRPAATPPGPGLYAPWRGFGKVWSESPELRGAIGWATEPEAQARRADIQLFSTVLLIRLRETGEIYALGNTNTPGSAQVIAP